MAWTASGLLSSWLVDAIAAGHGYNLASDTLNITLWNNTVVSTTAVDDTFAHNVYLAAGGQWVAGNEVSNGGAPWSNGGIALSSLAVTNQTGLGGEVTFAAANISGINNVTFAAFNGCMIRDTATIGGQANSGIVAIYFGGAYQVSAGSFAITWGTDGHSNSCIFYFTG